jgi:hypothetical protein
LAVVVIREQCLNISGAGGWGPDFYRRLPAVVIYVFGNGLQNRIDLEKIVARDTIFKDNLLERIVS